MSNDPKGEIALWSASAEAWAAWVKANKEALKTPEPAVPGAPLHRHRSNVYCIATRPRLYSAVAGAYSFVKKKGGK